MAFEIISMDRFVTNCKDKTPVMLVKVDFYRKNKFLGGIYEYIKILIWMLTFFT